MGDRVLPVVASRTGRVDVFIDDVLVGFEVRVISGSNSCEVDLVTAVIDFKLPLPVDCRVCVAVFLAARRLVFDLSSD